MTKRALRIFLPVLILTTVLAFHAFGWGDYFSLGYLQVKKASLVAFYLQNPALTLALFSLLYVLTTALSLPGATVLSLAAGAVFGTWVGTAVVSFASTLGATFAFLLTRFLFRDYVQSRFRDKIGAINEGVKKEGAFYLFTLRLLPIFPFFVINVAMALTPIRVTSFYWVSQVGMLPGTFVYVNAGNQIGALTSASGILSPRLILSFALIGLFPWVAKRVLAHAKSVR